MPEPAKPTIAFHRIDKEDRVILERLRLDAAMRRQLTLNSSREPLIDEELALINRLMSTGGR